MCRILRPELLTLTAVLQEQQKGVLDIGGDNAVKSFREKNMSDGVPINAGYMVLQPEIFDYITDDRTVSHRIQPGIYHSHPPWFYVSIMNCHLILAMRIIKSHITAMNKVISKPLLDQHLFYHEF